MRPTRMPLGRCVTPVISPIGSGISASCRQPSMTVSSACASRRRRSSSGPASPCPTAARRSERWRLRVRGWLRAGARRARAGPRRVSRAATRPCGRRRCGRRRPARRGWRRLPSRSCPRLSASRQVLHGADIRVSASVGSARRNPRPVDARWVRFATRDGPMPERGAARGGLGAGFPSEHPQRSHEIHHCLAALAAAALVPSLAHAGLDSDNPVHPLVGIAITGGGDKLSSVQFRHGDTQDINAGGLVQFYGGVEYHEKGSPVGFQATWDTTSTHPRRQRFAETSSVSRSSRSCWRTPRRSSGWAWARATRCPPGSPAAAPAKSGHTRTLQLQVAAGRPR